MTKDIPNFVKKYIWLLGQFVQNCLFDIEGVHRLEIKDLKLQYKNLDIAGLINKKYDLYGVNFDWENVICIVKYKNKEYNITDTIIEIVKRNIKYNLIDNIGFDTAGFDIISACKEAKSLIIDKIINL